MLCVCLFVVVVVIIVVDIAPNIKNFSFKMLVEAFNVHEIKKWQIKK